MYEFQGFYAPNHSESSQKNKTQRHNEAIHNEARSNQVIKCF